MCLCYLFSAKTAWQLVNRNADFFLQNESIRITNRIDSNRELECSSARMLTPSEINWLSSSVERRPLQVLTDDGRLWGMGPPYDIKPA